MNKATLITVDGQEVDVRPVNGKVFELGELYKLIDGGCDTIERVPLWDGRIMIVDEAGKIRTPMQRPNIKATQLYLKGRVRLTDSQIRERFKELGDNVKVLQLTDPLPMVVVGNVIVCNEEMFD